MLDPLAGPLVAQFSSSVVRTLPPGDLDRLPGERDLHVVTMLEGVQVTRGNVLTADITGEVVQATVH